MEQITAETERGWTGERPDENGIYWHRQEGILPELLLVHGGLVYDFGDNEPTSIGFYDGRGKWLGPVYASDTEQLVRLREVAKKALSLKWLRDLCLNHRNGCTAITLYDEQCSCGLKDYLVTDSQLREALQVKAEMKGEQL